MSKDQTPNNKMRTPETSKNLTTSSPSSPLSPEEVLRILYGDEGYYAATLNANEPVAGEVSRSVSTFETDK